MEGRLGTTMIWSEDHAEYAEDAGTEAWSIQQHHPPEG